MSINTVSISGNVTRDVELKTLPSGTTVANFGVAVTENRRDQNADSGWREETHFIDCVAFNGQAKTIAKFAKGKLVTVSGRLQQRSWEQQDGTKRSKVEVLAEQIVGDSMYLRSDGSTPAAQTAPPAANVSASAASNGADGVDDDIPF